MARGRSLYVPPSKAQLAAESAPSCNKCRNLRFSETSGAPGCANGRMLDARNCEDFKDVSRPRDYFANFDYNGRFRR